MNPPPLTALFSDPRDLALFEQLGQGLPLVSHPYAALGEAAGYSEAEVIERLRLWQDRGWVKRLGVIVRHRQLGYAANAMVVWDIPDDRVRQVAQQICTLPFVTLCYHRPRQGTDWPYNLFCMIHGRERTHVEHQIRQLIEQAGLEAFATATLFSTRCFKQRGARYRDTGRQHTLTDS